MGGGEGQLTANPADIDAVVRRAWKNIYDGVADATGGVADISMNKFAKYFLKAPPYEVEPLAGDRIFESFSKTAKSAGALDGWSPEEMALLSRKACHYVAIMLNLLEEGCPWPKTALHARVAYLLKEGAEIGQVMNYRPLTIAPPLYRCWGTCRLEDMHMWVQM